MVRHNNMIPNGHFHKKWQRHVKINFNQPFKKLRRRLNRTRKARKVAPRPLESFRPAVRCPTVRYHGRLRLGRGFTLYEIKDAGLSKNMARTIGIAVDRRRRNKSVESLQFNVQRLKEYVARLIVQPLNKKKQVDLRNVKVQRRNINQIWLPEMKMKANVPSEEMKAFEAYVALRKARADVRLLGQRLKKKNQDEEAIDSKGNKERRGRSGIDAE